MPLNFKSAYLEFSILDYIFEIKTKLKKLRKLNVFLDTMKPLFNGLKLSDNLMTIKMFLAKNMCIHFRIQYKRILKIIYTLQYKIYSNNN